MSDIVRSAAFFFVPFLAFGEVIEVDVGAWADVGTGTTNGWEVSGIDRYSEKEGGYTRLNTKDDYVISPDFTNVVTQVVMRVKCSNVGTERFLTLTPTISQDGARCQVAVPSESLVNETFTWALSEDVRGFRLQNDTGKGTVSWAIASLAVFCTARIEPPTGLREDALYRDAFAASWDPSEGAVRYEVEAREIDPPEFTLLESWDFTSLTNTVNSTKDLNAIPHGDLGVFTGSNLCLAAYQGGYLQVGKSGKQGFLSLPLPNVTDRTCLTELFAATPDEADGDVYVMIVGGANEARVLAMPVLSLEKTAFAFDIPDDAVELQFVSRSGRRIRITGARVVSDYASGGASMNAPVCVRSYAAACVVENLKPGEWQWRVRAFDADGRDSPWSPFRTVILDSGNRSYSPPGCLLLVR